MSQDSTHNVNGQHVDMSTINLHPSNFKLILVPHVPVWMMSQDLKHR